MFHTIIPVVVKSLSSLSLKAAIMQKIKLNTVMHNCYAEEYMQFLRFLKKFTHVQTAETS